MIRQSIASCLKILRMLRKYPNYLKGSLGASVSKFGDGVSTVAAAWLMHKLTGSVLGVSLVFILSDLPAIVFGPFLAAYVEKLPKKPFMLIADITRGILQAIMGILCLRGFESAGLICAFVFLMNSFEVLKEVTSATVDIRLIPNEQDYISLSTKVSAIYRTMSLLGMCSAGVLISAFDFGGVLLFDGITFFLCAAFTAWVTLPLASHENDDTPTQGNFSDRLHFLLRELKAGVAFAIQSPGLRFCIILGALTNGLVGPINIILPKLVESSYAASASDYSLLLMIFSLGTITSGLIFYRISKIMTLTQLLTMSLLGLSAAFIALGMGHNWILSSISMALIGLCVSLVSTSISQLVIFTTPQDKLGRVAAFMNSTMQVIDPVSKLLVGAAVDFSIPSVSMERYFKKDFLFNLLQSHIGQGSMLVTVALGVLILLVGVPTVLRQRGAFTLERPTIIQR